MNIVMFGPQGSGKGTQAELLSKKLKIPTVSAGELYRDNIKRKTRLGKLAEKYTTKGVLAPDSLTNHMMKDELSKSRYKKGVILDGYPRDIHQVKFLDKILRIDKAVLINIRQPETVKRLSGRRVCSQCGETYNIRVMKPRKTGKCDVCKGKLIKRADDYAQAIKKRLAVYRQQTKPVVAYYKKQGKLIKANGEHSIPSVFKDILKKLRS